MVARPSAYTLFAELFHNSSRCRASNDHRPALISVLQGLDSLCNITDMHARLESDNNCFNTQRDEIQCIAAATHGGSRQGSCTDAQDAVVVGIWVLKLSIFMAVGLFSF